MGDTTPPGPGPGGGREGLVSYGGAEPASRVSLRSLERGRARMRSHYTSQAPHVIFGVHTSTDLTVHNCGLQRVRPFSNSGFLDGVWIKSL